MINFCTVFSQCTAFAFFQQFLSFNSVSASLELNSGSVAFTTAGRSICICRICCRKCIYICKRAIFKIVVHIAAIVVVVAQLLLVVCHFSFCKLFHLFSTLRSFLAVRLLSFFLYSICAFFSAFFWFCPPPATSIVLQFVLPHLLALFACRFFILSFTGLAHNFPPEEISYMRNTRDRWSRDLQPVGCQLLCTLLTLAGYYPASYHTR